jgi:acyl-[acyl-carrier-protein]-phospholipid O-acyltransferase/long-chain-fatty-acid--[acyl-carrier-protein] ligase
LPEEQIKEYVEKLSQAGFPNLWIPRANAFYHVESLPILGTGKIDLRKVRALAAQFSNET